MKKMMMGFALALTFMASLVSCSDDQEISINMSGEWKGDFGSSYIYEHRNGSESVYRADETYLRFTPDHTYATHGYGTQVDYYEFGPYSCMYYQFDWDVDDERIYLTYPDCPEMNVVLSRFEMDDRHFSGRCGRTSFWLRKISDYYDWSPYDHGHGYHTRVSSSRIEGSQPEPGTIVRRFNQMMEAE